MGAAVYEKLPADDPDAPPAYGPTAEVVVPVSSTSAATPDADPETGAEELAQAGRRSSPPRRLFALIISFLFVSWLFAPAIEDYCSHGDSGHHHHHHQHNVPKTIEGRVTRILSRTPLIDGHNDLPFALRIIASNHINLPNFTEPFVNGTLAGQVDLARLRAGQVGGTFWSVWTPCPTEKDAQPSSSDEEFPDSLYAGSVRDTFQQIDLVRRLKALFPNDLAAAAGDVDASLRAFHLRGQIISPLGVEGLHQIGNSAANLRAYHALGVRYATLTHNCHNRYADAALLESPIRKATPRWGGVSPEGRKLVHEMNRLGMIVDLSHVSEDTMVDVLGGRDDWAGSAAPVIFSHSSAYSVCPHPRNVKDHVLDLVKQRGGVVMVNFSPDLISCTEASPPRDDGLPDTDRDNGTLAQVVRHIMYIGERIGFDYVGLGSDFDGIPSVPEGLEDVSKFPALVAELLRQGVSDEDAGKIVGGNVLRVWRAAERTAQKLADELPLEDDLPAFEMPGE